ncbi:unnamed protein product [Moneuplotes crassus]|uniref:Uncharacterized protein n=1 Tax=Euplotes crassus TaxID=5936 RepID=A0AAD1UB11_EUPCR|nr:unnamed protein product [Moneuplotes crassus]
MSDSLYSQSPTKESNWKQDCTDDREKCNSALDRPVGLNLRGINNLKAHDPTESGFRYSKSQKILFQQPSHRRQSAECSRWDEDKETRSYIIDSGIKPTTMINDDDTSTGGAYSLSIQEGSRKFCKRVDRIEERYPYTKPDSNGLVMKRLSSLEDLVWKLYEELDSKIQDIFEEHNNKFREQNDIIKNIFHGFGSEIKNIKEEVQVSSQKLSQRSSPPDISYIEGSSEMKSSGSANSSVNEGKRCLKYLTVNEEISDGNTLEKVIEEASKECITDNKEDSDKTITFPSNINRNSIENQENNNTLSNTQESNLCVANEKSPVVMMTNLKGQMKKGEESQESSEQLDIYFSCHERMVNGDYFDCDNSDYKVNPEQRILDYSSIRGSRDIVTMPEMNRSTLMDQIDYDLDGYKINESSMISNSIDASKHCIPKQAFCRVNASLENVEDVQPKFMGFLNENQPQASHKSERVQKESITMLQASSSVSNMLMKQLSFRNSNQSYTKSKRSSQHSSKANTSSQHHAKYSRNTRRNCHLKESQTYEGRQEVVLIRPNRNGSNKFETKPILSSGSSENMSDFNYRPSRCVNN